VELEMEVMVIANGILELNGYQIKIIDETETL